MKRIFTLLGTLLFSSLAWADAAPPLANQDLSIAYLGQIFGTVGNVLHGTSGDMMGQIFYKFNQGIFVVAGMWLAYTVTTMVLRSAAQGSFMGGQEGGKNWFAILRIPIGLALLVPIPATGYEAYQSLVMTVVVQGVNLANSTWSWALDYLGAGGVLYMPPSQAQTNAAGNYTSEFTTAASILASQTCMEISNGYTYVDSSNPAAPNDPTAYTNYTPQTDSAGYNILFPGLGNTKGQTVTPETAACGSVNWNVSSACSSTPQPTGNAAIQCSMAQAAVQQMVLDMSDTAKQYACSILNSTTGYCVGQQPFSAPSTDLLNNTGPAVVNAMVDYQNLMMPFMNLQAQSGVEAYTKFIETAKTQGWIMAGRYYWDVSMLNDQYAGVAGGAVPSPNLQGIQQSTLGNSFIATAQTQLDPSTSDGPTKTPLGLLVLPNNTNGNNGLITQYYGNQNTDGSSGGSAPTFPDIAYIGGLITNFIGPIYNLLELFTVPAVNPILFVHQLGVDVLSTAGALWVGGAITLFVMYLGAYICSGEVPVGQALSGAIDFVKPLLMVVITLLFGVGAMLAYYVPLYPYLIFSFASVGWFILVVESMVAAPLVCLGLTHPEGHDFLGKAEQALMLLLAVFVRPVLLVIGLIAGMILSYVALLLINTGYGGIISSLYGTPGNDLGVGTNLLSISNNLLGSQLNTAHAGAFGSLAIILMVAPTLLIIYAMLVYMVIQQSYSLIFVLPERILIWIGGQREDTHIAQMAQQVESAASSTGKPVGDVAAKQVSEVSGPSDGKKQGSEKGNTSGNEPPPVTG